METFWKNVCCFSEKKKLFEKFSDFFSKKRRLFENFFDFFPQKNETLKKIFDPHYIWQRVFLRPKTGTLKLGPDIVKPETDRKPDLRKNEKKRRPDNKRPGHHYCLCKVNTQHTTQICRSVGPYQGYWLSMRDSCNEIF